MRAGFGIWLFLCLIGLFFGLERGESGFYFLIALFSRLDRGERCSVSCLPCLVSGWILRLGVGWALKGYAGGSGSSSVRTDHLLTFFCLYLIVAATCSLYVVV